MTNDFWNASFYKELTDIYKFVEVQPQGIRPWCKCFVYHEVNTDLYVELLLIGSTYVLREQRGEDVIFNFYYIKDRVLERLDYIL